ncbi:hypothetical protein AU106_gp233 [Sinorhizobium phage phiM9]|uniref:Transmembrane protein n=1 Tax=Sinorhizobium phage phiM9 TaxID=1636182 RepID=A0A0F6TGW1_9CAUD|nr:hypothetical protein AU106_gp233 [Sinorhizobium phage phiM9]AKE44864.1 hypothetical protein Sm_phiM9_237 [Sinorhizobium phage phiM9]
MEWFWIANFFILWHGASLVFVFNNIGHKWRRGRWYDYPLGFPVFLWVALYLALVELVKRDER